MADENSAFKAFLTLVGGAFLMVAIERLADVRTLRHPAVYINAALGAFVFFVGHFWTRLPISARLAPSARRVAADFRIWLAIVFVVWIYQAVSGLVLSIQRNEMRDVIQKDIVPFRYALERWVIPRRLTPEQIKLISSYLRKHPAYQVSILVNRNDGEASGFRADIAESLAEGGWTITQSGHGDNMEPGLRMQVDQTPNSVAQLDDPRKPKPQTLLQQAFGQAGVRFEGVSGGSGQYVLQDRITIQIGPRRRDSDAPFQKGSF